MTLTFLISGDSIIVLHAFGSYSIFVSFSLSCLLDRITGFIEDYANNKLVFNLLIFVSILLLTVLFSSYTFVYVILSLICIDCIIASELLL